MTECFPWSPAKGREDLGSYENCFGRHSYASFASPITGGSMAFRGAEEEEVQTYNQSHDDSSDE
jgi:hypothetical protein